MFEEYKDLYELTRKTVDDHIEFYKKKESLSSTELFAIWKKLSQQAKDFDDHDWSANWTNWHKNLQGFERHKFEAKFLIQNYLTHVLEELITRIMTIFEKYLESADKKKQSKEIPDNKLSDLIRQEVKQQVKEELTNRKRKTKKSKK